MTDLKIKPVGKWILAKSLIGGQKTTAAGIIYNEKSSSKIIPAQVIAVGNKLTEDIQVGDVIWWDVSNLKDKYQGNHVIHQDWVAFVERNNPD
jgi:co-chaperonin GroES (HSP10)